MKLVEAVENKQTRLAIPAPFPSALGPSLLQHLHQFIKLHQLLYGR